MQSAYKCVYWHEKNRNWVAKVKIAYKSFHLGSFGNQEEANDAVIGFKKHHQVINGSDAPTAIEAFTYDKGRLIAKFRSQNYSVGDVVGSLDAHGYVVIGHKGKLLKAHRVIWEIFNGEIPHGMNIDHINGVRSDNRIENLRLVTKEGNAKNRRLSTRNVTGLHGVKKNLLGIFEATISHKGKQIYLGKFRDFFEACCIRKSAEVIYGYHENHGRKL